MQKINQPTYFARGWQFPPQFDKHGQTVQMVIDEDDIKQSLLILLSTLPGERLLYPTYGCDLHRFLFQEMSQGFITHLKDVLLDTITRYETRVKVDDIVINLQDSLSGQLAISLHYTVLATTQQNELQYTLVLQEGK